MTLLAGWQELNRNVDATASWIILLIEITMGEAKPLVICHQTAIGTIK